MESAHEETAQKSIHVFFKNMRNVLKPDITFQKMTCAKEPKHILHKENGS